MISHSLVTPRLTQESSDLPFCYLQAPAVLVEIGSLPPRSDVSSVSDPCCLSPTPCPFIDYTSLPVPEHGILVTVSSLISATVGDSFQPILSFSAVLLKIVMGCEGFPLVCFAMSALPSRVTLETVLLVHQTKPCVWKIVWGAATCILFPVCHLAPATHTLPVRHILLPLAERCGIFTGCFLSCHRP